MSAAFLSSLLGIVAHVLGAAASEVDLKVSVSVWPPGSNIFVGECVFLQCTVESNATFVWNYQWFRQKPQPGPTPRRRHLVSGDGYFIAAVTREDAGGYWCQAERWRSNTSLVLLSQPTVFTVSEEPLASVTLTPNSRQVYTGQRFTLRCPQARANSSGWMLRRFSPGRRVRKRVLRTDACSPLGGAVGTDVSDTCTFTAASENAGLYWCEGAEGRSNAVHIMVSNGLVILRTPAIPVSEGATVVLQCQYLTANHSKTTFFKNAAEVLTSASTARVVKMTLESVTQEDEGLYKCASQDGTTESPESWLSVRPQGGNFTSVDWTADPVGGTWTWITVSCTVVLLVLIPLTAWSVHYYRTKMFSGRSCWPSCQQDRPSVEHPATKQDATEVQWDLSWMEMSNLLDRHVYPST
eukprot:XP_011612865.1 PREDICTED: Fc receptor-like protein 1 [Takifugu rubripes]